MTPPSLSDLAASREVLEYLSRENAFSTYVGDRISLCRTLGRHLLYVPAQDLGIASHLMAEGYWEAWVTLAMLRTVQPGWRCVDVGAHAGYYSVLLADLAGPTGFVQAFEPNPETFDLLERNRDVNGVRARTNIHRLALGRESKVVTLEYPPHLHGSGSVVHRPPREHLSRAHVDMVTLDEVLSSPIHFLKVDAEGSDYDVLEGALRTLDASPGAVVFLEHLGCFYVDAVGKLDRLKELGFSLAHVDYKGDVVSVSKGELLADPLRAWNLVLCR